MRAEAPASGHDRPPAQSAAGHAGASLRPTVAVRPLVPVVLAQRPGRFDPSHPYVRRFWVAAIGPGAVAELLRLVRAAGRGEDVRLPRHLPALLRAGLVVARNGCLEVGGTLPEVPVDLRWRFPPNLVAEHAEWLAGRRVG
jgi:hypothetical protein